MTFTDLLDYLRVANVQIVMDDVGGLRMRGGKELPPDIRAALSDHKPALREWVVAREALPPCARCGGHDRWWDHGVWRCLVCAPDALTMETQRVPNDAFPWVDWSAAPGPKHPRCLHQFGARTEGWQQCERCGYRCPTLDTPIRPREVVPVAPVAAVPEEETWNPSMADH